MAIEGLTKSFGQFDAVAGIDLDIAAGEFFSLLGPSGCGKTTTLRMVAGFEAPTSGRIVLGSEDLSSLPSYKRRVNTVFQSYALFPFLSVFDNVAFGLRRHRVERREVRRRTAEALALVRMETMADRKPAQLSGGQQQRVALARALVLRPALLLLDEPLGALDAQLRRTLQIELTALQREVGITFVYVTHDQEEALTMSDRIAVMNCGKIEQVAAPRDMYEQPATVFVAEFLGASNLMTAAAVRRNGVGSRVRVGDFELLARGAPPVEGSEARIVIRPERVQLEPHGSTGANRVPGMVERVVYLGNANRVVVRLASGERVHVLVQNAGERLAYDQGEAVVCHLPAEELRVLSDHSIPAQSPLEESTSAP